MSDWLIAAGVIVGSYVVGGIPSAYIVGRLFFHADIREHGSGNVGTTNVYRTFGPWPALGVLIMDMAKGFGPVAVAAILSPAGWGDWLMIAAGLTSVVGHAFTPFLGLSGGKGVATAAGALLRLTPLSVGALIPLFVVLAVATGWVSLGSIVIAALYPVSVLVFYSDRPAVIGFSFLAAALVIWQHRSNIRRILRGEEKRLRPGRWRGGKKEKRDA